MDVVDGVSRAQQYREGSYPSSRKLGLGLHFVLHGHVGEHDDGTACGLGRCSGEKVQLSLAKAVDARIKRVERFRRGVLPRLLAGLFLCACRLHRRQVGVEIERVELAQERLNARLGLRVLFGLQPSRRERGERLQGAFALRVHLGNDVPVGFDCLFAQGKQGVLCVCAKCPLGKECARCLGKLVEVRDIAGLGAHAGNVGGAVPQRLSEFGARHTEGVEQGRELGSRPLRGLAARACKQGLAYLVGVERAAPFLRQLAQGSRNLSCRERPCIGRARAGKVAAYRGSGHAAGLRQLFAGASGLVHATPQHLRELHGIPL